MPHAHCWSRWPKVPCGRRPNGWTQDLNRMSLLGGAPLQLQPPPRAQCANRLRYKRVVVGIGSGWAPTMQPPAVDGRPTRPESTGRMRPCRWLGGAPHGACAALERPCWRAARIRGKRRGGGQALLVRQMGASVRRGGRPGISARRGGHTLGCVQAEVGGRAEHTRFGRDHCAEAGFAHGGGALRQLLC